MLDVATLFECTTRSLLNDLVEALPNQRILMPEKIPESSSGMGAAFSMTGDGPGSGPGSSILIPIP